MTVLYDDKEFEKESYCENGAAFWGLDDEHDFRVINGGGAFVAYTSSIAVSKERVLLFEQNGVVRREQRFMHLQDAFLLLMEEYKTARFVARAIQSSERGANWREQSVLDGDACSRINENS